MTWSLDVFRGAVVAELLSSWLAEQEDRGLILRLATWIFRDWLSPASKSRYGWKIAKSTLVLKTTNQPFRRLSHQSFTVRNIIKARFVRYSRQTQSWKLRKWTAYTVVTCIKSEIARISSFSIYSILVPRNAKHLFRSIVISKQIVLFAKIRKVQYSFFQDQ